MITVTLLAVVAGVVLTLNESPTYQALATIELQSGNENMLDRIGDTDVGAPVSSPTSCNAT